MRKSGVSDEDATRMLSTCPQQLVRVVLVNFGERHDTRTNGQDYTAADRRPTNQVNAWRAARGVARHARHSRSIFARMSRVSGVAARMSRECYEETASVEFKLWQVSGNSRYTVREYYNYTATHSFLFPFFTSTLSPVGVLSIVMGMSVCQSVCPLA